VAEPGWTFSLLGPLQVRHAGVLVPVTAAKQRIVIAALGLAAGEAVGVDRLIESVWGEHPPASVRKTLQNYMLRLRQTLQSDSRPGPVATSSAGYRLDVSAEAIDVHRLRSLLRQAQPLATTGEAESAAGLLDEALGLWRAQPLADVPSEILHREVVPGLVEQYLAALEQRIGLDLDRGRHRERISELLALTTEHPLRERMWAQLMLALYRCGRTAEALEAYHHAGKVLGRELGIGPGPQLEGLHQAVLTNDPALSATDPTSELAGKRSPAPRDVPRQLPPPSTYFVGRTAEVRRLRDLADATSGAPLMAICAIGGSAGIGKTALALHFGHLHADRFPDGQLYVNLRGFDPADAPVIAMAAMRGFLAALGVPAQQVPAGPHEQSALYRSRMAGRRMLVLLDNARDAEQVRPLLPGAPGCLVLVTSRDQLAGLVALDGAVPLVLDLLTPGEARDLLTHRLGHDRITRELDDVDGLIERCAQLPLALNIVAARMRTGQGGMEASAGAAPAAGTP
jgi:DNA-binding SARP family transcriptional activator